MSIYLLYTSHTYCGIDFSTFSLSMWVLWIRSEALDDKRPFANAFEKTFISTFLPSFFLSGQPICCDRHLQHQPIWKTHRNGLEGEASAGFLWHNKDQQYSL